MLSALDEQSVWLVFKPCHDEGCAQKFVQSKWLLHVLHSTIKQSNNNLYLNHEAVVFDSEIIRHVKDQYLI